ncbi:hypothetical protein BKA93DRAFT_752298 [Sparassis latifolia]
MLPLSDSVLTTVKLLKNCPIPKQVPSKLLLSNDAQDAVQAHIEAVGLDRYQFHLNMTDQNKAFFLLAELGVHIPDEIPRKVQSKFVIRHNDQDIIKSRDGSKAYQGQNRLYQCSCGMDNTTGWHPSTRRDIPWANVGCLAWLRLITTYDQEHMLHIHKEKWLIAINEVHACLEEIEMTRNPSIPLHPEVREYALSLFRKSYTLTLVRSHCRDWAVARFSPKLPESDILYDNDSFQYIMNDHETTLLYRTLNRKLRISQHSAAQDNLDLWFCTHDPQPPDPQLSEACLYYQPHVEDSTDRFVIIISTPTQRSMSWRFGHKKQIFLDGTFGFFFSAQKKTKHNGMHADYNSALMAELLGHFRDGLGTNERGESFEACVANTDNDLKECYGLNSTWPGILLILCLFHTWQSWCNGLHKHLRRIPKGPSRQDVHVRLGRLLVHLLKEIDVYEEALQAYNEEVKHFKTLAAETSWNSEQKAKGGLSFLAYLQPYLKSHSFWLLWSLAGVQEAAQRLRIPVKQVTRTTNPLESFQGRLKNQYFSSYLRSGRLPRLDMWIIILIMKHHAGVEYYQSKRHALPNQISLPPSSPPAREATVLPVSQQQALDAENARMMDSALMQGLEEDGKKEDDGEELEVVEDTEEEVEVITKYYGTELIIKEG